MNNFNSLLIYYLNKNKTSRNRDMIKLRLLDFLRDSELIQESSRFREQT